MWLHRQCVQVLFFWVTCGIGAYFFVVVVKSNYGRFLLRSRTISLPIEIGTGDHWPDGLSGSILAGLGNRISCVQLCRCHPFPFNNNKNNNNNNKKEDEIDDELRAVFLPSGSGVKPNEEKRERKKKNQEEKERTRTRRTTGPSFAAIRWPWSFQWRTKEALVAQLKRWRHMTSLRCHWSSGDCTYPHRVNPETDTK